MAHLPAKFHGDPTKTVEKLMFRAVEEYVYDCVTRDDSPSPILHIYSI